MKVIDRKLARDLQANFNSKFNVQPDDSNAVWFSIDAIEKFIADAKAKAMMNGRTIDGLRFYFGVYPKDNSVDQEIQGKTTLFISATNPSGSGSSQDDQDTDVMNYGGFGKPPRVSF
ncbi:hypothetical protein GV828_07250 [Flavobacterium sp. NST-5]|uniref:Phage protein n=1 Tax=Flavobacterium ichthyis TaxID=2698827 RepID=A0ABW9ZDZ2_9FLAO|nr:hypothetical protein [Flavobacterium ichthyis]NBL64993.1 hypothetical protein [Flavobacterium ichthyis]